MTTIIWMGAVWAVITITFFALVIYRSRLTKQETDWIPLTDDDREERAIKSQTIIEMKTKKLTWPIRMLGTASVVVLLAVVVYWFYLGIVTPPDMPK